MSIASEISRLQTAKNTLKTKINAKNNAQNQITDETIDEYGDFIDSIPTGVTPTGTKQISITQNGTTTEDVTNYANAQITTNVVNQDYEDALVAFGVQSALADSIEALTTYSNEVTGESDTTLSNAVRTLTNGYGGSGGLEYETGTWTPEEDITRGEIKFSKTHTEAPVFIALADVTGTPDANLSTNYLFVYIDTYKMWGYGIPYDAGGYRYAAVYNSFRASSTTALSSNGTYCNFNSDSTQAGGSYASRYWTDSTSFRPFTANGTRYWRAGRTYKWIAIWKPNSN